MKEYIKKNWLNLVIYISIIYVIYYLIDKKLLYFPKIHILSIFILSLFFLILGFISEMFSWKYMLKVNNINISNKIILISSGSSILGKYLPGKIWTVMGRAKIISDYSKISLTTLSALSFESQIVVLWTGLIISFIGALISNLDIFYLLLILIIFMIFTLIIFNDKFKIVIETLIKRYLKKSLNFPRIKYKNNKLILLNFFPWIIWGIGFYLMALSIINDFAGIEILFSFPLSVIFGILAIFSPGGIGIREGILTGYLTLCGIDLSTATTISVFSRLWFLIGELVIFLISIIMKTNYNVSSKKYI